MYSCKQTRNMFSCAQPFRQHGQWSADKWTKPLVHVDLHSWVISSKSFQPAACCFQPEISVYIKVSSKNSHNHVDISLELWYCVSRYGLFVDSLSATEYFKFIRRREGLCILLVPEIATFHPACRIFTSAGRHCVLNLYYVVFWAMLQGQFRYITSGFKGNGSRYNTITEQMNHMYLLLSPRSTATVPSISLEGMKESGSSQGQMEQNLVSSRQTVSQTLLTLNTSPSRYREITRQFYDTEIWILAANSRSWKKSPLSR